MIKFPRPNTAHHFPNNLEIAIAETIEELGNAIFKVNVNTLNMQSQRTCVLGQIYGCFWDAPKHLKDRKIFANSDLRGQALMRYYLTLQYFWEKALRE